MKAKPAPVSEFTRLAEPRQESRPLFPWAPEVEPIPNWKAGWAARLSGEYCNGEPLIERGNPGDLVQAGVDADADFDEEGFPSINAGEYLMFHGLRAAWRRGMGPLTAFAAMTFPLSSMLIFMITRPWVLDCFASGG